MAPFKRLEARLEAFSWISKRTLAPIAALLLMAAGCGSNAASQGASSGAGGVSDNGGSSAGAPNVGTNSGGGGSPSAGTSSGGSANGGSAGAPNAGANSGGGSGVDGFTLAPGLELLNDPTTCDGFSNVACSGHCVTKTAETNGCGALATARIFSEFVRDEHGLYASEQRSGSSSLWSVDPTSGTLMQLAQPPGDNMHLRLALGDDQLYFISNKTLFSVPRTGGPIAELLPNLPNAIQFVVLGGSMFAKIALDPELDELALAGGAKTVHMRDATSLARDGNNLYFAEAGTLYRTTGADLATAAVLGSSVTTILGFSGDWLYALGGTGAERAIRRFPKAGGNGTLVFSLGATGLAALANDAIAFTRQVGTRQYVCTVDLEGKAPTIRGYLAAAPALLAADEHYVYVTMGFNMVRVKR